MMQLSKRLEQNSLIDSKITFFLNQLNTWYTQNKRDLPWRQTTDPYKILVSEMMLQQTQVMRVIPKYDAFLSRFPTIEALAQSPLSDVLSLWIGLGYNRRAKYVHQAAQYVVQSYKGIFPNTVEDLITIPGIGPYTAGAICAFAYNKPVVVIDANVKKVLNRVFGVDVCDMPKLLKKLLDEKIMQPRDFYNALMDVASEYYARGASLEHYPFTQICLWSNGHDIVELKTYKQSKFIGSNRWYRGQILKMLNAIPTGELKFSDIEELNESEKYVSAIEQLLAEKLLVRDSVKIYLAK
jgi:A/G-specific adenine glycosylase